MEQNILSKVFFVKQTNKELSNNPGLSYPKYSTLYNTEEHKMISAACVYVCVGLCATIITEEKVMRGSWKYMGEVRSVSGGAAVM